MIILLANGQFDSKLNGSTIILKTRSNLESTKEVVFESNFATSEDEVGDVTEGRDGVKAHSD